MKPTIKFNDLQNDSIVKIDGLKINSDEIVFHMSSGKKYRMHHYQDCCESVYVEDVCGSEENILDTPVLSAEESSSNRDPEDIKIGNQYRDSFTWTFYRIITIKGTVVIRWYGESNGYYSESVSFDLL